MGVKAGATRCADGEIVEAIESHGDAAPSRSSILDVAGKFLAKSERRGVLQCVGRF